MGKIFCKYTTAIICLLMAILCFGGSSLADMLEGELFEKAYEYYLAYNPEKALETFDLFLQKYPDSSALDSIHFWRAKSLMQMKKVEEATRSFRKLKELFPESSYSSFADKELETLKNQQQKLGKSDVVREKTAKPSDANIPGHVDRIRILEKEKIDLEKQLSEVEKKRQITEKGLAKALDDKNANESQLEDSRKKHEELAKVSAINEKELIKLKAERTDLEARLRDIEKGQTGADTALRKISEEKQAVEAQLKDQQEKLGKSQETIAVLEKKIKGSEQGKAKQLQELEARASKTEDALSQLEDSRKKHEELAKVSAINEKELIKLKTEKTDLEARLRDIEKGQAGADTALRKISDEKQAAEAQLKDQQAKLAKSQETVAVLEKTLKGSEQEKAKQLQAELAELKRMNEQHSKENAKLGSEVSVLRAQALEYEKPFVKIGKEWYTFSRIISESVTAKNVSDKIQATTVPWRTGNVIDDFIIEQILARKAQEETLSADSSVRESLVKKYTLTVAEGAYLDKYLAIDRLVKKRLAAPAIADKEAREYYEKHKEQYVHGRENRIRVLSVKYGKADELEKSLVAVEVQQEAMEGKAFDVIARNRSTMVTLREMSLSRLAEWARVKIAGLKEGEISNIISVDNEFMVIQAIPSRPAYRQFEEVKRDIEKKLTAEQSGRKQPLEDWLNSLKKEVEFLR